MAETANAGAVAAALNGAHAPHLALLPGTNWALWRWVGLRGTGFPVEQVLKMGVPECAAVADALNEAEADADDARETAVETVRGELTQADASERPVLVKALRRLEKGKLPQAAGAETNAGSGLFVELTTLMQSAAERVAAARSEFREAYQEAVRLNSAEIVAVARCPRFREAIIWQNRSALHSSIDALLRMSDDLSERGSDRRRREDLVASYLQRYCMKNDTIGFFGPVGWARLSDEGEALTLRCGETLLARRRVYFESWGMDELGAALARDGRLKPWLAPRRVSFARVDWEMLHVLAKQPVRLDAAQVAVYELCDGERMAVEIAAELAGRGAHAPDEARVYELLRGLEEAGALTWQLEALVSSYPEQSLQRQLSRIGDAELRVEALSPLDELEAARERIAGAAGDPALLDNALEDLETRFTRITGTGATRAAGRTYAGRTLVYEDCRRDAEVTLGPELWTELGRPLALLLESARWFTHAVAETYRDAFGQLFTEMTGRTGGETVEFWDFWSAIRPMLFDPKLTLINRIAPEFQRRWAEVLELPEGAEYVEYSSEELWPKVRAAFTAPRAGWVSARYHNPDVMIAASSVEAVRRGEYLGVMGELHIAANALGVPLFMEQHEAPDEFRRAVDQDIAAPRLVPLVPKYWPTLTARLMISLANEKDYRLELAPGPHTVAPSRLIPVSELLVERASGGQLVARSRERELSFDLLEALSAAIGGEVANHFKLLSGGEQRPRVQIDRLVVARRSWRFLAADLWFAFESTAAERFQEARRWAGASELPRHVFVKAAVEVKPFYVDLASPVYVEALGRAARRCVEGGMGETWVSVSEMLPEPEGCWLRDAAGQTYASELRFVAFDLKDTPETSDPA